MSGYTSPPPPFAFNRWQAELLRREQRRENLLWGLSLLSVCTLGAAALCWVMLRPASISPAQDTAPTAIAMDLAPSPVSIPAPPTDAPPGPQQTLSQPDPTPCLLYTSPSPRD